MRNSITHRFALRVAPAAVALVLAFGLGPAGAQGLAVRAADWTDAARTDRGDEVLPATTLEVSATRGRLVDPAALPTGLDGRATRDVAAVTYRVWMSRGRTDVGLGLGSLAYVLPPTASRSDTATMLVGAVPALTLGVRYHVTERHLVFADALGGRGLGADPAAAYVSTQVGVEWRPAKSTLGFDHGALGVQLDSGYRLSLKARGGGAALYLRGRF
jgi:hypothetical protein